MAILVAWSRDEREEEESRLDEILLCEGAVSPLPWLGGAACASWGFLHVAPL